MTLEMAFATLLSIILGGIPAYYVLSNLYSSKPLQIGHTYLFPDAIMRFASIFIELIKGVLLLPLLEQVFHLLWLPSTIICGLGVLAALWSPLRPSSGAAAMLIGILLKMHFSVALLTLAVAFVIFAALAKPITAGLLALFMYPLLTWSFIPSSHYPTLGLLIAGLAYVKWWSVSRNEKVVHELS